jgi:hypothetical protein
VLGRHVHPVNRHGTNPTVVSGNVAALAPFGSAQRGVVVPVTLLSPLTWVPQLTCDLVLDRGCSCRSMGWGLVQHAGIPSNTTWFARLL